MANTRTSAKRARQTERRQKRNQIVQSSSKSALKNAILAIKANDLTKAKEAYASAIRSLSKAASKGAIPRARASRKISRLTHLAKKAFANFLNS